jgi:hypothetical protein
MPPRPPVEENAMIGTKPYAKLKYREVKGRQMAYTGSFAYSCDSVR